jgi:type IV secretory pathway VirB2 component (pilin)
MLRMIKAKCETVRNKTRTSADDFTRRALKPIIAMGGLIVIGFSSAHATATTTTTGTNTPMPWETPLKTFLASLTGPVAQVVGVAAVVMCGFAIAFSEGGGGIRKLVWVALGLSIAYSAATIFIPLFTGTTGVAF